MGELAPGLGQNLWVTAVVLLACVVSLWLLSIRLRDTSIIDIFWGPAFGIVALVGYALSDGHGVEAASHARHGAHRRVGGAARHLSLLAQSRQRRRSALHRRLSQSLPDQPALAHADQSLPAAGISRLADLDAGAARAVSRAAACARSGRRSSVRGCGRSVFSSRRLPTGSSRASRPIPRIAAACSMTACGVTAGTRTISATRACGGACGSSRAITRSASRPCSRRS